MKITRIQRFCIFEYFFFFFLGGGGGGGGGGVNKNLKINLATVSFPVKGYKAIYYLT